MKRSLIKKKTSFPDQPFGEIPLLSVLVDGKRTPWKY
jgi:hypothetical protein